MGEQKFRSALRSAAPHATHALHARKMTSQPQIPPHRAALTHSTPTAGNATVVRCPPQTSSRLKSLNEAEVITLFTPVVPHPPDTNLVKNMDPFEPLGRSLPCKVRHVPYRLELGLTTFHADFLPTSGAVMVVICSTDNVVQTCSDAFQRQLEFAQKIADKIRANPDMYDVPLVLLLVANGANNAAHLACVGQFPVLVTIDDYSPPTLSNAVKDLFSR